MPVSFDDRLAYQSLGVLLARCQPMEVAHLIDQVRAGRINGMDREACLIGHVARLRKQTYETCGLSFGYSWEAESTWQIKHWLMAIHIGNTPQNSVQARMLEGWLMAWLEAHTLELQPAVAQQVAR